MHIRDFLPANPGLPFLIILPTNGPAPSICASANELVFSSPVATATHIPKSQSRSEKAASWQTAITGSQKTPTVTINVTSPFIAKQRQASIEVAVSSLESRSRSRGHREFATTAPGREECWPRRELDSVRNG